MAKSSYGLFRREPHSQREHGRVLPVVDEVDGGKYVPVINYFVTKVSINILFEEKYTQSLC